MLVRQSGEAGLELPGDEAGENGHHWGGGQEDCSRQSRVQPGEAEVGGRQEERGQEAHQQHLPPGPRGPQGIAPQHQQQTDGDQQLEAGAEDNDDPGWEGGRQGLCCSAVINISLSS